MKACFIKLDVLDETEDNSVVINVNNISSVRRLDYNGTIQTMVSMLGTERFSVHQTPDEILDLVEHENSKAEVYH